MGYIGETEIKRSNFSKNFIFGAATSAYQIEGAWNIGGKGMSNWDAFTLHTPDGVHDFSNGCVAIDHYNMFKEDVALMKKLGLDSYRFSIAWTRILPGGKLSGGISKDGIKFYNNLIDALLAEGIEPCVTLFHWDVPQCLEDEYGGFLSDQIVKHFCEFAEVCFWEFGDRVKKWITLNEPWSFTRGGYVEGKYPPCRGATIDYESLNASMNLQVRPPRAIHRTGPTRPRLSVHRNAMLTTMQLNKHDSKGNPGTEPYIVAHNLILAHAHAVDIYKKNYQKEQGGNIGMTNVSIWCYPLREGNPEDEEAALRAIDFVLGWFVAPVVTGDYPPSMRKNVKERLPQFNPDQVKLVKGSCDFLGINYYTSFYAKNNPLPPHLPPSYDTDKQVEYEVERDGVPIGPVAGLDWLRIVPKGIYDLMIHVKKIYNNPEIYITENGVCEKNQKELTISQSRKDEMRINYHRDHLIYLKKAIDDGVRLKGYFMWSLMDNFEWAYGYEARFGIFYVDFVNGHLTRFPKTSAIWWMNFLSKTMTQWKLEDEKTKEKPALSNSQETAINLRKKLTLF